jgi:2-polyprenyl-6-methoxyphenol hydroxylase-like FAD-dependent oxidoreductase
MTNLSADVLVVGGGPTGLAMTSELLRHGVTTTLIEARPARDQHSKAISISAASLQLFDHMGLIDDFLARGARVQDIVVHVEGRRFFRVDYGQLGRVAGAPYPYLLSLPQPEAEEILEDHVGRRGGRLRRGLRLVGLRDDSDSVVAEIEDLEGRRSQHAFRYVVGCDGSRSRVRQLLGIPFDGSVYDVSFIHGDFDLTWDGPRETVHYFASRQRFGLIIPMANRKHRVVVQVSGSDPGATHPAPGVADFEALLAETGVRGLRLAHPEWISHARLYHVLADSYGKGRVFLAGDACHLFSPIGGQGMNTGFGDAFNLAWKLAYVLRSLAPPDLLDSYQPERRPVAAALVASGDASTQLLLGREGDRPDLLRLRADLSPRVANRRKWRDHFPVAFSGLAQSYGASRFLLDDLGRGESNAALTARAGHRAPDATFGKTGRTRLHSLLRGRRHVLLLFAPASDNARELRRLTVLLIGLRGRLPGAVELVLVEPGAAASEPGLSFGDLFGTAPGNDLRWIEDVTGDLRLRYGACPGALFLIRPDRYIEFSGSLLRWERLIDHLDQIYLASPLGLRSASV